MGVSLFLSLKRLLCKKQAAKLLSSGSLAVCGWVALATIASAEELRSHRLSPDELTAGGSVTDEQIADDLTADESVADEPTVIPANIEEIPEEILRTEIITGARSPLTGEPISAAEYAQLQAALAAPAGDPLVSQDLRYLIFLLQIRRGLQPIIPFL